MVSVLAVSFETGVAVFIRRKGVTTTGDEPHYLIAARALTHFNPHVVWAYRLDLQTHYFFDWPAGTTVNGIMHGYAGPHGVVSAHGLGLPLLIVAFLALGGKHVALGGFFAIETGGLIYLHQRASWLVGLTRQGKIVFALALAGPALWIAGTQLYPDLITGIFLACALIEMAVIERDGKIRLLGGSVFAFTMAYLPWLHVKNFLPAGLTCLAFAAIMVRTKATPRTALIVGGAIAASWILLLAYDLYYFGHLLGFPQPTPGLTKAGLTAALALVFDRYQGLLAQVPAAVLGLAGLWLARRRVPISVIATVAASSAVIIMNGTYISDAFGGTALAGRFEWTTIPVLLAWCPHLIARLESAQRPVWGVGTAIVGLWIVESIPILSGRHQYYNVSPPWDPLLYPGWWARLDVLLPGLSSTGRVFGAPWYTFAIEVALLVSTFLVLVRLARPQPFNGYRFGAGLVVVVAATGALTLWGPRPLPARSLSFTGSDLGGPLDSGAVAQARRLVTLESIAAGTCRGTLHYTMSGAPGSAPGAACTLDCTRGSASSTAAPASVRPHPLPPEAHAAVAIVRCPKGTISVQVTSGTDTRLVVQSLVLTKTAS